MYVKTVLLPRSQSMIGAHAANRGFYKPALSRMRKAGGIKAAISISAPHKKAQIVRVKEVTRLWIEENL